MPDLVELEYGPLSHKAVLLQAKTGSRTNFVRTIFASILVVVLMFTLGISGARADVPRAYAGIVVDAKTGSTLYSYAADSLRYPASVTKVMTLYILFQELKAGRMTLSTRLNVSRYASRAIPTKLNVPAGGTITVENAIKALIIVSANDIARVVAENISGSEEEFARRMTRTARALGMSRTTYANASGLPNSRQVTTVRDQARLAMAIFQHFPQYYDYFQKRSFRYGGRNYGSYNRLLGQNGVDGLKTGYIRASGYNLLTAARKDGRHIIVVGFGFNTGAARNTKVRSLITTYLGRARRGSYWRQAAIPTVNLTGTRNNYAVAQNTPVVPAPRPPGRDNNIQDNNAVMPREQTSPDLLNDQAVILVANSPFPAVRANSPAIIVSTPAAPTPIAVASLSPTQLIPANAIQAATITANGNLTSRRSQPIDVIGAWISRNFTLGSSRTGQLQNSGVAVLLPPASIGNATAQTTAQTIAQTIDLMTSASIETSADQTTTAHNNPEGAIWVVQIGAPPSSEAAQNMLANATNKISTLGNYRSYVEQFNKTGQTFFRARFTGFAEREQAINMCEEIKLNNISCLAVQS